LESLIAQKTSELRSSEAKWRSLVECLPQFVWSTRADGYAEYVSTQWAEYSGLPQQELLGSGWLRTLHPADRDRVYSCWQKATSTVGVYNVEYRIQSHYGAYRWFVARGSPVRNDEGQVTHWLGTTTDIEDQKRSEERLEAAVAERTLALADARDRAECAARAKSSFLAAMSHEIRTPMNGVIGMTDIVLETALSAEQRSYIATIRSCGQALLTIINDILDFSKIEAGKIELENVEFDLRTIFEESLDLVSPSASVKGLHVSLDVGNDVPSCGTGDPGRLRQVLLNTLSNAVKFTERGSVSVSVTKEAVRDGVMTLRIAVRDSGIGMTPEQQANLFQAFTQADRSTTRRFGGTGLGLVISKRLVELMGGTMGVSSQLGEGSTFWFNICLSLTASRPETRAKGAGHPVQLPVRTAAFDVAGARVLLVEDNLVNQKVASLLLTKLGCRVTIANSGVEACSALENASFDVVLMDCQMPDMDGFEATRIIRQRETNQRTPIIALTAGVLKEERDRCYAAGMDDFLAKPIVRRDLEAALENWLSLKRPEVQI
jgi:PAS domain S-box-containing protein